MRKRKYFIPKSRRRKLKRFHDSGWEQLEPAVVGILSLAIASVSRDSFNLTMETRNLPIGIQDFEKLRKGGCLYVDKTAYVYKLARAGEPLVEGSQRRVLGFTKGMM